MRRLQQFAGMGRTAEPRTVDLNHIVKDVLEMTRGRCKTRPALPIGVVSGWGDVAEAAPGTQAAVDFVLSKPLTLEALADALGRLGKR